MEIEQVLFVIQQYMIEYGLNTVHVVGGQQDNFPKFLLIDDNTLSSFWVSASTSLDEIRNFFESLSHIRHYEIFLMGVA